MGEIERRALTLELLNCHLEDAGRKPVVCIDSSSSSSSSSCTKSMSDAEFQLYTSFFIDIDHICFFLNHEIWMDRIQLTVDLLESTSTHVAKELGSMETKTKEISKAVESLSSMQQSLMLNVERASSSAFYIAGFVVVFLLTIPQRSSAARLPCLVVLACCLLLERNHDTLLALLPILRALNALVVEPMWFVRNLCVSFCLLAVALSAYRFRDLTQESLRTIERFLSTQQQQLHHSSSVFSK